MTGARSRSSPGEVYAGMGDTVNEATSKRYTAGTFFVVPAGHVHYSWAKDPKGGRGAEPQANGIEPHGLTFSGKGQNH